MPRTVSTRRRRRGGAAALFAAGTLLLSVCANSPATTDREDLLAAAGFDPRPANTPERAASMLRLPPSRFVQRVHGNRATCAYADPRVCNCIYFGDQAAYDRYRRGVFQRRLADERELTDERGRVLELRPVGAGPGLEVIGAADLTAPGGKAARRSVMRAGWSVAGRAALPRR